ncbi:MAG: acetyl-CoA C-acyltransferase [Deltaproteobacteria bacterium]|nr:acetyl-CoA C-acyltransferase [Deltaproteobacteria bacterium]
MKQAVIVASARTPIGKAFKGAFNSTHGADMAAHAIKSALERAKVDPGEIEDVVMGCGLPEGSTGNNVGRIAAIRAGCPVTVSGMTVNRFCSSGLQAVAIAAQRVIVDGVPVMIGAGVESISRVQKNINMNDAANPGVMKLKPGIYFPMGQTAEIVASRYKVSRESQDDYSLLSQQRTAEAQKTGKLAEEIVPMQVTMTEKNKETGEVTKKEFLFAQDEGNRPDTTIEGLRSLKPAFNPQGSVTAGNSSQLSDGAAAVVVMSDEEARRRNLNPLGAFRGLAVAGCEPDEMGIGPVFAVPLLLKRFGLRLDDIDLIELNEAFAVQVVYCRDKLGIDPARLNVNGGAISIGHPYGMTGARQTGSILMELRRRKKKWGIVTMCIGGGMGAAGLFEAF